MVKQARAGFFYNGEQASPAGQFFPAPVADGAGRACIVREFASV